MGTQKEKTRKIKKSMRNKYNEAFQLFITGTYSYRDLAKICKTTTPTLVNWAKAYDWNKSKEEVRRSLQKEIEKKTVEKETKYVLNICELQETLESEMDNVRASSLEGLVREIRELEKLKLLKLGKPTEIVGISADDLIRLDKEIENRNENSTATKGKQRSR